MRRIISGLRVDDETLSVDLIKEVEHGGSYLMHRSTMKNYKKGWQPAISDWNSYEVWKKKDPDIESRAHTKALEIIGGAKQLLDPAVAKDLASYIKRFEG